MGEQRWREEGSVGRKKQKFVCEQTQTNKDRKEPAAYVFLFTQQGQGRLLFLFLFESDEYKRAEQLVPHDAT